MSRRMRLWIPGPIPTQGSGRAIVSKATGRAFYKPSNADVLARFRADVRAAVDDHDDPVRVDEDAVRVTIVAILPRPKGHFGTGKNAERLKESAPRRPGKAPDIDKVARAVGDALVAARVLDDDAQIVALVASKHYAAKGQPTGVQIDVEVLP